MLSSLRVSSDCDARSLAYCGSWQLLVFFMRRHLRVCMFWQNRISLQIVVKSIKKALLDSYRG